MNDSEYITKRQITYNRFDKKTILIIMLVLITCLSLPKGVKCEIVDTIASLVLFIVISVFICAGIGWWSKRGEMNK